MTLFDFVIYGYIAFFVSMLVLISRKGRLYVFSPIVIVYLSFLTSDVLPFLMASKNDIPKNLYYVVLTSCIINILFMFIYRKDFFRKVTINNIVCSQKVIKNRHALILVFAFLLLVAGITTGMISMMWNGVDVEDYRVTSDIGMGFIRVIPVLGIPILLLSDYFTNNTYTKKKLFLITILCAFLLFITTASRASILAYIGVFLIWFCIKKRTLKWWEYIAIYYIAQPVVGTFLQLLRGAKLGQGIALFDNVLGYQNLIFYANTIPLMSAINDQHLLYGDSYYYSLVRIIPRFLWADKPIAIDYTYKKLIGYDFDGGGIFTTNVNELYMNFGHNYVIFYALFLFIVHSLYRNLLKSSVSAYNKIIICIFMMLYMNPRSLIESVESLLLFLFVCYCFNKKWKIF